MQRLIDSIYRDYPSGSVLMWRTDEPVETRDSTIETNENKNLIQERLLLLDGQQRITTLAAVLDGLPIRIREGREIKLRPLDIYFNLDHPEDSTSLQPDGNDASTIGLPTDDEEENEEETGEELEEEESQGSLELKDKFFQVWSNRLENQKNWISVTSLFKEGVWSILKMFDPNDPNFEKYSRRLEKLYNKRMNYFYPVQVLPKALSL